MLPSRALLVIVIILSSIFVVDNIVKYATTSKDAYFAAYDSDETTFLAAEKSYIWGFKSPWLASEDSVFHNLVEGSNFVIAPFGIFYLLFKADLRIVFLITKFLLAAGYFIVSYKLIRYFFRRKSEADLTFIIFALAVGLGGIAYLAVTNVPFLRNFVTPENYIYIVGGGSLYTVSLGQLYLSISLLAGYASVWAHLNQKYKIGALLIGLSIIAYPAFGNVFLGITLLYAIIYKKINRHVLISLLAYVPWIIIFLQTPMYYKEYSQAGLTYTNAFAFLVYGGFVLLFALYAFYDKLNNYIKTKKIDKDILFIFLVGVLTVFLSLIPTPLTLVAPRYIHLTVLPLAIIAMYGILNFSKSLKINPKIIVAVIVILSLPTIFVFYFFVVHPAGVYITEDEHDALLFLKDQPSGNVISTRWPIGAILPYYAEKRSMLGRMTGTLENPLIEDTKEFFSGVDMNKKKEILLLYNITYVFFGPREVKISANFDPDSLNLSNIYENNTTKIYRIKSSKIT